MTHLSWIIPCVVSVIVAIYCTLITIKSSNNQSEKERGDALENKIEDEAHDEYLRHKADCKRRFERGDEDFKKILAALVYLVTRLGGNPQELGL